MRGYVFYLGAGAFCLGITFRTLLPVGVPYLLAGMFLGVISLCFRWVRVREVSLAVALCASFFLVGAIRAAMVRTTAPDSFLSLIGKHVSLEGTIVSPPDVRETSDHLTIEVHQGTERTRVLASVPLYPTYQVGEQVRISGIFDLPQPFETEGGREFAYDKFLAKDGIFAIVKRAHVQHVGFTHDVWLEAWNVLTKVKDAVTRALGEAIPEPYASLADGILVGGKQGLGPELIVVFTATGLLQMVVLSGYNVSVVAEAVLGALRWMPRMAGLATAAIGVVTFVTAAGASSSAVRAGLMALIALAARATDRTYAVLRALCFALVLMLLWNPLLLVYDPGFQLSFLATLGLILGVPLIETRLAWIKMRFLREAVATTVSAQISVLPLLLYQSGNLSLVSIPANVLTMPVVPLAMLLSAGAAFAALCIPIVAPVAGLPAFAVLWYVIAVARSLARIPFAQVIIPAFPFWIAIGAYIGLAMLAKHLQKKTPAPAVPASSSQPVR